MTRSPQDGVGRSHLGVWLVVFVGSVALASALLVGGARSASQASGLIAFTRDDGVYVMRPDGGSVRLLWRGDSGPNDLSWSPDASRLAISTWGLDPAGRPSKDAKVWVVNADGSSPVPVARVGAASLSWSPDGRRIAFTTKRGTEDPDVWVMNADGSDMRRLKRTPKLWDSNVDWRPSGGWLAFDSGSWVPEVHVIRTDGTHLRRLTSFEGWAWSNQPVWSPDGRRITFACARPFEENPTSFSEENSEICTMKASGTGSRLWLTKNRVHDGSPAWSADGRKIAFVRGVGTATEVYVMNADGTHVTRLTHNRVADSFPAWQPVAEP